MSLSEIEFFVLDEADRMLDMGFIEPIRRISRLVPTARQTMLFSATMPKEIRHLADALLREPVTVTVTPVSSAVDRIDQKLYFVLKAQKTQLLVHLFDTLDMDRTVVFTKTKHGADRLARKLKAAGIHAEAIHGDKAQNQRVRALDAFRSGRSSVLVATDVAARGLDIDDITHVVNFDQPMEPEAYVHRIGRTARAGKSGHAISFCDVEEKGLLKQVERLIKFEIPRVRVPDQVPKSDEAASKAGLAPKERPEPRASAAPMIETRAAPMSKPRVNASGRPIPQHAHPPAHSPAPRAAGPRIDRRMDEGPRDGPRVDTRVDTRPERGSPRGPKPAHPTQGRGPNHESRAPHAAPRTSGGSRMQHNDNAHAAPHAAKPAPAAKPGAGAKPAKKFGPPKHGGPARFGQNPFAGGKPRGGSNFKGGTGFKGPKPSR